MSIFADNIVFLRGKNNLTQQKLADELILTRSRYVSYEYEKAEPPIDVLIRISKYYNISIDLLVTVDIRKYPIDDILNLPNNRVVLPIVVDKGNGSDMEFLFNFIDNQYYFDIK